MSLYERLPMGADQAPPPPPTAVPTAPGSPPIIMNLPAGHRDLALQRWLQQREERYGPLKSAALIALAAGLGIGAGFLLLRRSS